MGIVRSKSVYIANYFVPNDKKPGQVCPVAGSPLLAILGSATKRAMRYKLNSYAAHDLPILTTFSQGEDAQEAFVKLKCS